MFAAKAGAKHVYAVDNSDIITYARKNATDNNLADKITFIQGKVEDIALPCGKVDVIVSEWMGYFLLFEGMLDSVLRARDLFLKPTGILAPSNANIEIGLFEDEEYINDKHTYWNNVYGFKMTAMKDTLKKNGQVEVLESRCLVSDCQVIKTIDIKRDTIASLDFKSEFKFTLERDATVHGIVGWFDCFFKGPIDQKNSIVEVVLPTGPQFKATHWRQTLFLFDDAIAAKKGDVITGTIECKKNPKNERGLLVTAKWTAHGIENTQVFVV